MIRAERTRRPADGARRARAPRGDARRSGRRRPGRGLAALLAPVLAPVLAPALATAFVLAASPLGAASPPSSWQRQTLLAATEDEYLVLETEGHKPGSVDVWTETVRFVRFDARSNARGEAELVRVETWSPAADGTRRTDVTRSSNASLGAALDAFGGRLAPPPAIRLKREFRVDAEGVHVFDADAGVRVPVLTREEIAARARRGPHGAAFDGIAVTGLQQIDDQFFLTLRAGAPRVRRELVLRIPR